MLALQRFSAKYGILLLTYSLGGVFLWFGLLKMMGMIPVSTIITLAMPPFITELPGFFMLLGLSEVLIGLGFFFKKTAPYAAILMILHLLVASISVLITQGFSPMIPFLTLPGEFVIKNVVFLTGGLVVLGFSGKKTKGK